LISVKTDGSKHTMEDDDWPGLAAVILAAVDWWNAGKPARATLQTVLKSP